jgi:putative transposase
MGRPLRILQNEYPYHVTTRTNNKEFRFKPKRSTFLLFARIINLAIAKYSVEISHFVLMSNHYHIIFKTPNANIHRVMQFINSMVAREYNKRHNRSGHLWGDRYKSTIIENDEYLQKCAVYIYMNPVRAGIVNHPKDYLPSTYHFYAFNKEIELYVNGLNVFIPYPDPISFQKLFDEISQEELASIKRYLNKPIYGSDDFLNRMKVKYKYKKRENI